MGARYEELKKIAGLSYEDGHEEDKYHDAREILVDGQALLARTHSVFAMQGESATAAIAKIDLLLRELAMHINDIDNILPIHQGAREEMYKSKTRLLEIEEAQPSLWDHVKMSAGKLGQDILDRPWILLNPILFGIGQAITFDAGEALLKSWHEDYREEESDKFLTQLKEDLDRHYRPPLRELGRMPNSWEVSPNAAFDPYQFKGSLNSGDAMGGGGASGSSGGMGSVGGMGSGMDELLPPTWDEVRSSLPTSGPGSLDEPITDPTQAYGLLPREGTRIYPGGPDGWDESFPGAADGLGRGYLPPSNVPSTGFGSSGAGLGAGSGLGISGAATVAGGVGLAGGARMGALGNPGALGGADSGAGARGGNSPAMMAGGAGAGGSSGDKKRRRGLPYKVVRLDDPDPVIDLGPGAKAGSHDNLEAYFADFPKPEGDDDDHW